MVLLALVDLATDILPSLLFTCRGGERRLQQQLIIWINIIHFYMHCKSTNHHDCPDMDYCLGFVYTYTYIERHTEFTAQNHISILQNIGRDRAQ